MTFTPYPPFNPHSPVALLAFFTHVLSEDTLIELSLPKLSLQKLSLQKLSLKKLSLKKVSLRQLSSWGLFLEFFSWKADYLRGLSFKMLELQAPV